MKQPTYVVKDADEAILLALARFHYLTAAQISRLLYPRMQDRNREAHRRTKDLADAGYIERLGATPKPQYGKRPNVCTLTDKGRKYVQAMGASVQPHFRPVEEKRAYANYPFMRHTLAAIDGLIAAERLSWDYDVSCPRMMTERDLKHSVVRVDVPAGANGQNSRSVAVIPDGWFELQVGDGPAIAIALELDRATEEQKAWRNKVAAYNVWAGNEGPYADVFETNSLTIAVVCPHERRAKQLLEWTLKELRLRNAEDFAEVFLFTHASPETTDPYQFFFGPRWLTAHQNKPIALLDTPAGTQPDATSSRKGTIFSSV
jgi:Replication-relaxation